jgi:hypothetical protein
MVIDRFDEPVPSRAGMCNIARRTPLQVLLLGTIGMQVMRQCLRVDLVIMVAFLVGC